MLSKILEGAETAPLFRGQFGCSYSQKSGVIALVRDIFKDVIALTKVSEVPVAPYWEKLPFKHYCFFFQVKFLLLVIMAILLGYIVHRRFGFRVISIILGGCFLTGYFYTYIECNRVCTFLGNRTHLFYLIFLYLEIGSGINVRGH